jgi:hypothetical protein
MLVLSATACPFSSGYASIPCFSIMDRGSPFRLLERPVEALIQHLHFMVPQSAERTFANMVALVEYIGEQSWRGNQ